MLRRYRESIGDNGKEDGEFAEEETNAKIRHGLDFGILNDDLDLDRQKSKHGKWFKLESGLVIRPLAV